MRLTAEENPEAIKRYGHIKSAGRLSGPMCATSCPGAKRTCSRSRGHRGAHVAHGLFGKVAAVWDSDAPVTDLQSRAPIRVVFAIPWALLMVGGG